MLFVVSGPSGVGKSTLLRKLLAQVSDLSFAVSHTTRPPREGEVNGRDYHFVSDAEFSRLIDANAFVEWAVVHGRRYGTSHAALESGSADLIIEVDVQGAAALKEHSPRPVMIFIEPPAFADLETRITGRGRETADEVKKRLQTAEHEMPEAGSYDHRLVNDDLESTVAALADLIRRARSEADSGD